MVEKTTISLRIPKKLSEQLGIKANRLKLRKIDFIRFILEAALSIDENDLETQVKALYAGKLIGKKREEKKGSSK